MISGRRSPYRRRGLLSGLLADAIDDHSQRKEDKASRGYSDFGRAHSKSLEPRLHQEDARGRSDKGAKIGAEGTEPHLPSYEEATEVRPRALSAAPAAGSSFQSSDRGQNRRSQHLMPPGPSMAEPLPTRPRSAQNYYGQSMSFGPEADRDESYLRDPRLMDSFLHDPYSGGLTLFGPREPTYLSPRHERGPTTREDRHSGVNDRRRSGGLYLNDVDENPSLGRRGGRQSLLGSLVGAAVQSGVDSHNKRRERAVSMEPPTSRRMGLESDTRSTSRDVPVKSKV